MTLQEERDALQKRMDEIDDVLYGDEKTNFVPGWYVCCDNTSEGFQCNHFNFEEYKLVQDAWNHIEPLHMVVQNFLPEGWKVVGPEPKTLYDWSKAPGWANWIATDEDGELWAFEGRPVIYSETAHGETGSWDSGQSYAMPLNYKGNSSVPWDQSLEQRPGITQ